MGHTPGPWAVRWPADGELHEIYAEDGGDLICYPVFTANQAANIPLIAAAPELLAVLKGLWGWEDVIADFSVDLHVAMQAAIAKAEGRSE